jgi:hypothetical protein
MVPSSLVVVSQASCLLFPFFIVSHLSILPCVLSFHSSSSVCDNLKSKKKHRLSLRNLCTLISALRQSRAPRSSTLRGCPSIPLFGNLQHNNPQLFSPLSTTPPHCENGTTPSILPRHICPHHARLSPHLPPNPGLLTLPPRHFLHHTYATLDPHTATPKAADHCRHPRYLRHQRPRSRHCSRHRPRHRRWHNLPPLAILPMFQSWWWTSQQRHRRCRWHRTPAPR